MQLQTKGSGVAAAAGSSGVTGGPVRAAGAAGAPAGSAGLQTRGSGPLGAAGGSELAGQSSGNPAWKTNVRAANGQLHGAGEHDDDKRWLLRDCACCFHAVPVTAPINGGLHMNQAASPNCLTLGRFLLLSCLPQVRLAAACWLTQQARARSKQSVPSSGHSSRRPGSRCGQGLAGVIRAHGDRWAGGAQPAQRSS
jgi:hypothetical protein